MKRLAILFVWSTLCLVSWAQDSTDKKIVRILSTESKIIPLPYRGSFWGSDVVVRKDSIYLDNHGDTITTKVVVVDYRPNLNGQVKFKSPVWIEYDRKRPFKDPDYTTPGVDRGGERTDVSVEALLPYPPNNKAFVVEAVTYVLGYSTRTFFSLDLNGKIIDRLVGGSFLEDVTLTESIVNADTTITVYDLKVFNYKWTQTLDENTLRFNARRTDTKYMVTPEGRFKKVSRIIYKRQPYFYDLRERDPNGYDGFKIFHVTDGREAVARTVQYRQ